IELAWDIDSDERRMAAVLDEYRSWLVSARRDLLRLSGDQRAQRRAATDLIFHGSIGKYVRIAEPLRAKIENFNVMCPIRRLEKVNLWVDYRVEQLEAEYAVVCRDLDWEPPKAQAVTQARKAAQERERDAERARHKLETIRQLGALQKMRQQLDWVAGEGSAKGMRPRFLRWRK
ncbi:MAG: hypothetical protein NTZ05_10390, partial [Chloroflexi bacterium]|nr:hypothetical protein [Chloroflexota bacterium]